MSQELEAQTRDPFVLNSNKELFQKVKNSLANISFKQTSFGLAGDFGVSTLMTGFVNDALRGTGYRTIDPTDNIYDKNGAYLILRNSPWVGAKNERSGHMTPWNTEFNALEVYSPVNEEKWDFPTDQIPLLEQVIDLARKEKGREPTYPFRAQRFYAIPDKTVEGEWPVRIEAMKNFEIIESEELYYTRHFNRLDENGLTIWSDVENPFIRGAYPKHWGPQGIKNCSLSSIGSIGTNTNFASYNENGRIFVVYDPALVA